MELRAWSRELGAGSASHGDAVREPWTGHEYLRNSLDVTDGKRITLNGFCVRRKTAGIPEQRVVSSEQFRNALRAILSKCAEGATCDC